MKFVWYKLAGVTSLTVKLLGFYKPSYYSEHSAVVMHNSTFAMVYGRMRCSGSYKYKFQCDFATMVVETTCYFWLKQSQINLLQGHTKCFCLHLEQEQRTSG